jgi:sugar lactone lactonase YvrE
MTALRVFAAAGLALVVAASAAARPFPDLIALPDGFQPEGIAVGQGTTFYVGSIPTGEIYRGDLRTGAGAVLVDDPGRAAIGIDVDDKERIFVAGGPTGRGFVYGATGESLAEYQLAPGAPTFVNDVIVTREAAWFTDSNRAVLYRVPIAEDGSLGDQADVETVPLTGDFESAPGFNTNGIDATPDGGTLVIVQSNRGRLYTVDAASGEASLIELSGGDVAQGDGILLDGKTLYVVQNRMNRIAVVALAPDLGSGTITGHLTDPDFDVPTTIAEHGDRLYAVNARFGNPDPGNAEYSVVGLRK